MVNIARTSAVQHALPLQADQPKAEANKFETALREAKTSGKPANTVPSPPPGEGRNSSSQFVQSIESTTNGANVAKILTTASNDSDIDQVLSSLSQSELNRVAKELNGAGLSQNEVSELCNSIVSGGASGKGASDANLAKLTQAFINNPPSYTSWALKSSGLPIDISVRPPPPDLALTLESLIADAPVETAVAYLQALPPSELNAVLTADQGLNAIAFVNAAATTGADPNLQARVFQAATNALTEIPGWQNARVPLGAPIPDSPTDIQQPLLGALTHLLESNPQGITAALQQQDPGGEALTTYAEAMLGQPNSAALGKLFDALKFGPNKMPDPNYVNETGEGNNSQLAQYQNAQILGYFVGAVQKAIANTANPDASGDQLIEDALNELAAVYPETGPADVGLSSFISWAQGTEQQQSLAAQDAFYEAALQGMNGLAFSQGFELGYHHVIPENNSTS
jgi:hypothetical protein